MMRFVFLPLVFLQGFASIAQVIPGPDSGKVSIFTPMADDPYAASLDSLLQATYFKPSEIDSLNLLAADFENNPSAPGSLPDSVYIHRLRKIDAKTPFNITFNNVINVFCYF